MMRSRTKWTWRLKLYPFIALGLFVYVAAQGSGRGVEHAGYPNPRIVGSASNLGQPAFATPQTAAFPDRVCWIDHYPLESFCWTLTQERR